MKLSTTLVKSSVVLALLVSFIAAAPAYATSHSNTNTACAVKMVGGKNSVGETKSRWSLNADKTIVTGTFEVTGDNDCIQTVTLAAWEAPNATDGRPYNLQKLVDHITKTFSVGTHSMSIVLPNCFYQIDMVRGSKATGENGSPVYPTVDMMGSLHGGSKSCDKPVTPETPVTQATPVKPEVLPATGTGSNVALIALTATVLGTLVKNFRLRRTA